MKPALLARLRCLDRDGALPASQLSASMRRSLRPLFDGEILVERRAGGGRRVVVADREGFARWIAHRLPEGLEPDLDGPPRSAAIAAFRDAKVARAADAEPMLLRMFREAAVLRVGGAPWSGVSLTAEAGCVAVLLSEGREVSLSGRIGVVENLEAFLYAERLGAGVDAAMYAAGRLSRRRLAWMAAQLDARWVHLGDYDPVGLCEYLRVASACEGRTELFVPPDLESLVHRYSKAGLMEGSAEVWARVRSSADPAVREVVGVLERHARGLEHEILVRSDSVRN